MLYIPVELNGVDLLRSQQVADSEIRALLMSVASIFTPRLQRRAPVRTGRLRASLRVELLPTDDGVALTSDVRYAGFVEFGTRKMSARLYAQGLIPEIINYFNNLVEQKYGIRSGGGIQSAANTDALNQGAGVTEVSDRELARVVGNRVQSGVLQPAIVLPASISSAAIFQPLPPAPKALGKIEAEIRRLDDILEYTMPNDPKYATALLDIGAERVKHRELMDWWMQSVIDRSPVSAREAIYWAKQVPKSDEWDDLPKSQRDRITAEMARVLRFVGRSDLEITQVVVSKGIDRAGYYGSRKAIDLPNPAFIDTQHARDYIAETIWHELGHAVERQYQGLVKKNLDLIDSRADRSRGSIKQGDLSIMDRRMQGEKYVLMARGKEFPTPYWSKIYSYPTTEIESSFFENLIRDSGSAIKSSDPDLWKHLTETIETARKAKKVP